YNDYSIEPLMQTIDILNEEFDNKIFIKAVLDNKIIGSARANWYQKSCWINKVVVHPAYQNQGIGKRLMHEIENCFNEADKHILYTGYKSKRNLHLYKKLGYKKVKSGQHANNVHLIHLEKINKYGNTK
ncbi:MAG: GNAT family N-acetyltransferase, partial [Bacteroidales bacterium]|nr:GNAT family N-acetyltransferase [Bacteroidales bacterium]